MDEAAPKRSAGRWLVILGGVGAVIGVLCCGGYAVTTGGTLWAFRGVFTAAFQAMLAPGTSAMRGLGCEPAMVLDGETFTEAMRGDFERWGMELPDREDMEAMPTMLLCQVPMGRSAPEPEAVARAYVDEVHPTEPFEVIVKGNLDGIRQGFDASGTPLGPPEKR